MRCPACKHDKGYALWVCAVEPTPETLEDGKPLSPGWIRNIVCASCGTMRLARDEEDHKIWVTSVEENRAVGHSEVASTPPIEIKPLSRSKVSKEKGSSGDGGDQTV